MTFWGPRGQEQRDEQLLLLGLDGDDPGGLTSSVLPSSGGATASLNQAGRYRRRAATPCIRLGPRMVLHTEGRRHEQGLSDGCAWGVLCRYLAVSEHEREMMLAFQTKFARPSLFASFSRSDARRCEGLGVAAVTFEPHDDERQATGQ